jgi:hypothetical protein
MRTPDDFREVYWLGGGGCSGKSSVARILAERYSLPLYSCDDAFEDHLRRADPERHATFLRIGRLAPHELWAPPAETQASELLGFYQEWLDLVLEDLANREGPLLAEGAGLRPELIAPYLTSPDRALWLVATPELRRRHYPRRGAWVGELLGGCDDPEATFERWMDRDDRMAISTLEEVRRRGFVAIEIDGSRSLEEVAAEAAAWFELGAPLSAAAPPILLPGRGLPR